MSEPALSLAFFDGERELHGTVRAGVAIVFERDRSHALDDPPAIERDGESWRVACGGHLDLTFTPCSPTVDLGGTTAGLCRVSGRAEGGPIDCAGTASVTETPPAWDELDALRTISAVFDHEHAVLAAARRPRGSMGHGQELVVAHLLGPEGPQAVEDARVSTVYDSDGRQRTVGLELWMPGEDFPRRASGRVQAGLSLTLEGLRVNAAIFGWRMDGREGLGSYEVTVRDEPAEAA
ncbi:MAG: hypothetical protein QOD53_175 [Thermoleophilaceae bacterium]|nr:hypothetical protein [Thermoleophilaceae bacterium]